MGAIKSAQSCSEDVQTAVSEFCAGVEQPDLSLVVFFCSPSYDLDLLAQLMQARFPHVPVIGCTALGTYGPLGYRQHSLSGASFSRSSCVVEVGLFTALQTFDAARAQLQVQQMRQSLESQAPWVQSVNTFAFQLIDGLSVKEETVTRSLQNALGAVFMVGGSAADEMQFQKTWVYWNGAFHSDCAVLALIATRLPFQLFMTQHFTPLDERMVVTRADTAHRIVYELNGLPAAAEYARCAGVAAEQLGAGLFSRLPVVVRVGEHHYVRSIQQQLPDGALRFYCAIEVGMVLRLAQGGSLVAGLEAMLAELQEKIGEPQLILGCDCALRRLEVEQLQLDDEIDHLSIAGHVVGFATFGEQYRGVHLNQTLSGVAFGQVPEADDDDRR